MNKSESGPQHLALGLVLGVALMGGIVLLCLGFGLTPGYYGLPPKVHHYNDSPAYAVPAAPAEPHTGH